MDTIYSSTTSSTSQNEDEIMSSTPMGRKRKQNSVKKFSSCSVPSCRKNNRKNPDLHFPKFPSDENRCWKWVQAVGDPDLVHVPVEKLCTLRRVCSEHFTECDFSGPNGPNGKVRLSSMAIPRIFKSNVEPLSEEVMKDFVGYAKQRAKRSFSQFPSIAKPQLDQHTEESATYNTTPIKLQIAPFQKYTKPFVNENNVFPPEDSSMSSRSTSSEQNDITLEILVCESSDEEGEPVIQVIDTQDLSGFDSQQHTSSSSFVKPAETYSQMQIRPTVVVRSHSVRETMCSKISSAQSQLLNNSADVSETSVNVLSSDDSLKKDSTSAGDRYETEAQPLSPCPLQVYPMRVQPGREVTSLLKAFVEVNCLKAAFILTCVGSISQVDLRFATNKAGDHTVSQIRENLEICSLVGTVCRDGFHLHGTFGNSEGETLSGHVIGNMIVQTTAEIILGQALGVEFNRVFDYATGFRELVVQGASDA